MEAIMEKDRQTHSAAVLLAAFGAARPEGLADIFRVRDRVEATFPDRPVRLCFTSEPARRALRKAGRSDADDGGSWSSPIIGIRGALGALADLQEMGFKDVAVQPLFIFSGEEYHNLKALVDSLAAVETRQPRHRPFQRLVLGRPVLETPCSDRDLDQAAAALAPDLDRPEWQNAVLVYMGHGNQWLPPGVFGEVQEALRRMRPGRPVLVGAMEGAPSLDDVARSLKSLGARRVVLVPFLLAAGRHAIRDMAGDGPESWQSVLTSAGFEVQCILRGLGSLESWADLYVRRLEDLLASL